MSSKARRRRRKRRMNRTVSAPVETTVAKCDLDVSYLNAVRLFNLCKGKAYRKASRTPVRFAGIKPLRSKLTSWQARSPAHGEPQEYRRDRRAKTPYARDFIGPRERRVRKDRAVTVGECVPIGNDEHFFDGADLHSVAAR